MPREGIHFLGKKILVSFDFCFLVFLSVMEFGFIGSQLTETIFIF